MLMLLIKDARTLRKSRGGGKKHAEKKKRLKKIERKKNSEVWEKYKKFPDGTEG